MLYSVQEVIQMADMPDTFSKKNIYQIGLAMRAFKNKEITFDELYNKCNENGMIITDLSLENNIFICLKERNENSEINATDVRLFYCVDRHGTPFGYHPLYRPTLIVMAEFGDEEAISILNRIEEIMEQGSNQFHK